MKILGRARWELTYLPLLKLDLMSLAGGSYDRIFDIIRLGFPYLLPNSVADLNRGGLFDILSGSIFFRYCTVLHQCLSVSVLVLLLYTGVII